MRATAGKLRVIRKMKNGVNCFEMWWPGTELNRRRQPFQGCALPPELPGHVSEPAWLTGCEERRFTLFLAGFPAERNSYTAVSGWNEFDYNNRFAFSQRRNNPAMDSHGLSPIDLLGSLPGFIRGNPWLRGSNFRIPSRTQPGCAGRCPTGLSRSMVSALPSRRYRRCRDGSRACLRRILSGT